MRPFPFFLFAGLLFGGAFALVTPPFHAADEPAHFFRAYALSEGEPARHGPAGFGAVLPASLQELADAFRADRPPGREVRPEEVRAAFGVPLDEERRVFVDYRTSAQLTPVPYLPQAAGIWVARALGAPVLGLVYAARLANLLTATALIAFGLRRLPSYSWLLTMLALTPMALFLRGSMSADAVTMAMGFVLAGTAARLAWGAEERAGWGDVAVLAGSAAALCLSKPVYVPLALLVLLIPAARLPGARRGPAIALVWGTTAVALALALVTASGMDLPLRTDVLVDRDRQIRDALAEPLRTAWIMTRHYLQQGDRYMAQIVGQLGWLHINLPKPFLWISLCGLGLLVLCDGRRIDVTARQRVLLGFLVIATIGLVSAAQLATWTPYGADDLDGIQGRYFIPLVPAAVWLLHTRRFAVRPGLLDRVLPWLGLLSGAFGLWLVLRRYAGG